MDALRPAILVSLIAASVTTLGLVGVLLASRWTQARLGLFAAFAAGALVTAALLHLMPEALSLSRHGPVLILCGFAGGFLLNRGVFVLAERRGVGALAAGLTPALGIGFHSLVDGAAYAITFSVSFETGLLTAIGLVLHEAPEGVIVFALLRGAGFSVRDSFIIAFFAAACTTPFGAAVAYPFLAALDPAVLGDVFAVAAGVLLYVGAGHLLPHVERDRSWGVLPAAAAGALAAFIAEMTHDHSDHGHGHGAHRHGAHEHDHDHHDHAHGPDFRDHAPQDPDHNGEEASEAPPDHHDHGDDDHEPDHTHP